MTDRGRNSNNHGPSTVPTIVLEELYSLNTRFIEVLCHRNPLYPNLLIEQPLFEQLSELGPDEHRKLASCPYSLFNLNLSESEWWMKIFDEQHPSEAPSDVTQFTLTAMIHAQRIAIENADLGGVLLGMNGAVCRLLRKVTMGDLLAISHVVAKQMNVRLIGDPKFWVDLINFVKEESPNKYLAAQTSALQILAARY